MWGEQGFDKWWLFLLFAAMTAMLFIRLRLKKSLQDNRPASRDEGLERLKESNRRKSLQGMLVEIHDINRELTARVDNKLSLVTQLAEELKNAKPHSPTSTPPAAPQPPQPDPQMVSKVAALEARIVELEKRLGALEDDRSRERSAAAESCVQERQNRHADIFDLHKQGLSALEIAERVGRQRGEVELILGLGGVDAGSSSTA